MDKAVTREDAQGVIGAEVRNKADMSTTPGGLPRQWRRRLGSTRLSEKYQFFFFFLLAIYIHAWLRLANV